MVRLLQLFKIGIDLVDRGPIVTGDEYNNTNTPSDTSR